MPRSGAGSWTEMTTSNISKKFINFSPPLIGNEEINEVVDTLRSGWITTGPKVSEFEKEVCRYVGNRYAAATFSCTAALFLALKALGIKEGDEVIVPTFTFASTAHVVVHCGATPVFVDINPDTLQMDTSKIQEKITSRTRAIIPVHYGGNPVEMSDVFATAKKNKLFIIEDAAHAIGAEYQGKKIGSLESGAACFSFYATKNIATAEGGMVVTGNEAFARTVKKMAMYGISDAREIWSSRYTKKGHWFYDIEMVGYKANMADLNAAIGLHQLKKLDNFNMIREKYADIYKRELKDFGCDFMEIQNGNKCAWHLFPLLLPVNADREKFIVKLKDRGIGTSVLYRPLHLHTAYRKLLNTKEGDFPVSEAVFKRLVNLPISPAITEEEIRYIAETVKGLLS